MTLMGSVSASAPIVVGMHFLCLCPWARGQSARPPSSLARPPQEASVIYKNPLVFVLRKGKHFGFPSFNRKIPITRIVKKKKKGACVTVIFSILCITHYIGFKNSLRTCNVPYNKAGQLGEYLRSQNIQDRIPSRKDLAKEVRSISSSLPVTLAFLKHV